MQYRKLGRYGIKVSEVSLGGWLTHGRSISTEATRNIVHRAFDLGINFFDTADVYHQGEAELALATAIADLRRQDLVIATKCFFPFTGGVNDRGLSRKHISESVHASLKRLNVDYIDLMQFHRFDADTPLDETVRAIDDLARAGKVLYWGVSEWNAAQITDLVHTARSLNALPPASNQPLYNMLHRSIEGGVIPTSEQFGLGQVVFSPLAQGVLTGKYLPGQPAPEGTRASDSNSNQFMGGVMTEEILTRVQQLKKYVEGEGFALPSFALAWCLRQRNVSSVIIGASRPEQVDQNVIASGLAVAPEQFAHAEAILAGNVDAS
ncbi:MAG: aldo/keto reductase family protein [Fimbriimonadaceae bacterium]|nr:aldo/keto reductase family protein [Fimbriimonadaceae bacterium]